MRSEVPGRLFSCVVCCRRDGPNFRNLTPKLAVGTFRRQTMSAVSLARLPLGGGLLATEHSNDGHVGVKNWLYITLYTHSSSRFGFLRAGRHHASSPPPALRRLGVLVLLAFWRCFAHAYRLNPNHPRTLPTGPIL